MSFEYHSGGLFGRSSFTSSAPLWQSVTCNCACSRCMSGSCCLVPDATLGYVPPTYTTANTTPYVSHEHDYAKFDAKRLFCRKCGETKEIA